MKKLMIKPEADKIEGREQFEFSNSEIIATPLDSTDLPMTQKETEKLLEPTPNTIFSLFRLDRVTNVHRHTRGDNVLK